MTKQLAKACSQVADVLPRTDLSIILYPTEIMKEAVARLYVHIIGFIVQAFRWYKQGKLAHAWAAVAKPWELTFKDQVDYISEQARRVEELAASASRAELRDAHVKIWETRQELQTAREGIQTLSDLFKTETQKLLQVALGKYHILLKMYAHLRCLL